jgi:hypothetical protein
VEVAASVFQLPAEVPDTAPIVHRALGGASGGDGPTRPRRDRAVQLRRGVRLLAGDPDRDVRADVGGPWGDGTETISTEFVPISVVREFTKIYAHTFMTLLG